MGLLPVSPWNFLFQILCMLMKCRFVLFFSYTKLPETFIGAVAFHEVFTSDVNLCYVL